MTTWQFIQELLKCLWPLVYLEGFCIAVICWDIIDRHFWQKHREFKRKMRGKAGYTFGPDDEMAVDAVHDTDTFRYTSFSKRV